MKTNEVIPSVFWFQGEAERGAGRSWYVQIDEGDGMYGREFPLCQRDDALQYAAAEAHRLGVKAQRGQDDPE